MHDQPYDRIEVGFDWSPDGKQIAFVGQRNNQDELVIVGPRAACGSRVPTAWRGTSSGPQTRSD